MGNNNSSPGHVNQTRSNQPYHPAYQRELPNGIIHFPVQPKLYNPEFKVLPARVPGQKLRITENGRLLQNGGTISGRREMELPASHIPDSDLLRALNRRSAIENGMGMMEPEFLSEQEKKKYYSNPDLIKDETAVVSNNPNGDVVVESSSSKYRGLFFKKKTKAPAPPQIQIPIHPLPPPHFDAMGRALGRSESFRDPFPGVKVQPWPARPDNTSMIRSMTPMERITEPDGAPDRLFKTHSDPTSWETKNGDPGRVELTETQVAKLGSLPWTSKSSDRSDISQERRFYKYKSETSEIQRRVQRKASMDRRENSEIQKRARSMDSLHVALEKEKLANLGLSPMRKSMDSLHIAAEKERLSRQHSFQSDSRHDFLLGKHSRQNSSERDYGLINGHIKPSDLRVEALRNTASLQRNQSLSRQNSDHSSSIKDQLRSRDSSPTNWKLEPKEGSFQKKDPLPTRKYYFGGFMDNKPTSASSDREKPFGDRVLSTSPQRSGLQRSVSNAGVFSRAEFTTSMEILNKREEEQRANAHTNAITLERRPITNGEVRRPESRSSAQRSNGSKDFASKDSYGGSRAEQEQNSRVIMRRELESRLPKQGRQRNSYAFEDRRYRHEVPVIPSPPMVREVPISREVKENPTPEGQSDDEMDISMQLRPTLPKRMPAIPRFSPTQAWRSLNLEYITNNQRASDRSSEDGDVFEDRIHRVTRPVAPPRAGNEKCGDSGISQDAGSPGPVTDIDLVALQDRRSENQLSFPAPAMPDLELGPSLDFGAVERGISPVEMKRTTWTPEEDLPSDFDGGSGGEVNPHNRIQPNMVSVPPKLIPIKSMFSKEEEGGGEKKSTTGRPKRSKAAKSPGADPNNPYTFNSMRKLKRSLSGVLGSSRGRPNEEVVQNRDENWSFSRSLPNSLHNGCDGCEEDEPRTRSNSEIGVSSHLRRAESGPIHPSMNGLVGVKGRVMSVDNLHSESFYEHRPVPSHYREGARLKYSAGEHIIYLPEYDAKRIVPKGAYDPQFDVAVIKNGFDKKKPKKFTYQSTVRQQERRRLEQKLSQEVAQKEQQREREMKLVNEVEEEFQRKREKEKANLCQQLKILSLEGSIYSDGKARPGSNNSSDQHDGGTPPPPLVSASEMYLGEEQSSSSSPVSSQPSDNNLPRSQHDSGFFGGISKWMRRQQRLEQQQTQHQHRGHRSRQEPDGAPSPLQNRSVSGEFQTSPPSPLDARTEILAASRFSNGGLPLEHDSPLPYGKINKLNGLEENLQEQERSNIPSGIDDRYQYILGDSVLQNKNIRRLSEEDNDAVAAQVHRSSSGRAVETKAKVKEAGGRKKLFMMMINKKSSASLSGGSNSRTPSPPTGQAQYRTDLLRIEANPGGSQRSDSEGGGPLQRPRSSIEDSDHSSDTEDYEPRHHSRYRSPLTERRAPNGHSHSRSSSRNTTDSSSSCDVSGRQKNGLNPKSKIGEVNGHHSDKLKSAPSWDSDAKGSSVTSSSSFFFTPVQPFNLNKGYRPVVFNPMRRQGLDASQQFGQEVEHQRL